jgi:hypothetical protein
MGRCRPKKVNGFCAEYENRIDNLGGLDVIIQGVSSRGAYWF